MKMLFELLFSAVWLYLAWHCLIVAPLHFLLLAAITYWIVYRGIKGAAEEVGRELGKELHGQTEGNAAK